MKKIFRACALFVIVALTAVSAGHADRKPEEGAGTPPGGRCDTGDHYGTYAAIHSLFIKWDRGLFGSRRYYEKELYRKLLDSIGECVTTGADYFYRYEDKGPRRAMGCAFYFCDWLYISGDMDMESIKLLIEKDPALLKKWWRSTEMVSLTGRIKKFYLVKNVPRRVILVLDGISVKRKDKAVSAPR
ncbi:MAG TPA: hypothetical protein ENN21_07265 [Spirochaetes bacterium]|nr:hypothetical protein [Spirochaetota bacterium]